ncbi:cell wall protein Ecm33 [Schizosaccharomyces japonicus yFS275]|uniref:Cell wall protein Ecm33 n=1 Tax=Schizosaccharomyces japonicus (strain yFS275 / FY16936) TaxID=402676 RepID=B6JVD3_SCHJY|nr:cell wall protein Ecm33 [Schizosaccharomyces japonicus yFS275]EEB05334.1 cell wall protein Ecm33 [Schizosaccharomyces japonicus yFS275]
MVAFKSTISAALLVAAAFQQAFADDSCTASAFNITAQGHLDNIASCTKLTGDLYIKDIDNDGISTLTANGIESVDGDVVVSGDAYLTSMVFPSLKNVTGTFSVNNMIRLSTLSAPVLTKVAGLNLAVLPNLQELQFNAVINQADSVTIDDTDLQTIQGINLDEVDSFTVTNNRYIQDITMADLVKANTIKISANAKGVNVNFGKLSTVGTATFSTVGSVFVGNLKNASGSLGFSNTTLANVSLPYLTEVDQSLYFMYSESLTNLSFPNLTTVGGSLVINDTGLTKVSGFSKLTEIGGSLDIYGNFSSVEFPVLSDIKGSLDVQTKATNFTCPFSESGSVVKGNGFTCKGTVSSISYSSLSSLLASATSVKSSGSATATATATAEASTSLSSQSSTSVASGAASTKAVSVGIVAAFSMAVFALFL